jgi:hypothetical protein
MNARIPVLLAAVLAAACGYKPVKEGYPANQPAYVFPHGTHVDADVACTACHEMSKATRLDPAVRHVKIPAPVTKQKVCADCHDKEPVLSIPKRDRAYRVNFSHQDHLTRVQDCKACHVKVPEVGDTAPATPPMATCTACHYHQQEFAQARCTPCHVDLKGYQPESAFRHEGNWIAMHGALARPSAESCAQCHDQTFCVTCHSPATTPTKIETIFPERVDRAFIHRGDYVSRHMVDAAAQPANCRRCHGSQFCDACHAANNFSPSSSAANLIAPPSHSSGWSNTVPGDGGRHRTAARRDISSCAACHDQRGPVNSCRTCHGGNSGPSALRFNPHPKKFLDQFKLSDVKNNSMCRECHRQP